MKAKDIIIGLLFLAAIVLVFVVLFSIPSGALSDETKEIVNNLRWKHYGHPCYLWWDNITFGTTNIGTSNVLINDSNLDYEWWSFYFEDGKLFVETQDGKWYIKMKEVIK